MFVVRRFPEPSSTMIRGRGSFCGPPQAKTRRVACHPDSLMDHGLEKKDSVTLSFDVPGVKKEHVSIEERNGVLQVSAERKTGNDVVGRLEKKYKIDQRMVDVSNIHANLSDGVLSVVLPKSKDAQRDPAPITITPGYPPEEEQEQGSDSMKTDEAEFTTNEKDKEAKQPSFHFSTDIPGVKTEDVEVKLVDVYGTDTSILKVRANRQKGRFVTEIHRQCTIPVSHFDVNEIQVYLVDGVLTVICLPRVHDESTKSAGPRKIPVNTSLPHPSESDTAIEDVTTESKKEVKHAVDPKEDNGEEDAVLVETVKET